MPAASVTGRRTRRAAELVNTASEAAGAGYSFTVITTESTQLTADGFAGFLPPACRSLTVTRSTSQRAVVAANRSR